MEIIDRSPYPLIEGKMSFMDRLRGSLEFGFPWYAELQAQESIISSLSRLLGNDYIAMHGVLLPETDIRIPLMVIGPSGLHVLYVTPLAGVYRAKGENWLNQESGGRMRPARPNLLSLTQLMGRAVDKYLKGNHCDVTVQTALLCSSPKMFVDSIRPSTRVILSDAVEKYITSWAQDNATLSMEQVLRVADLLTNPPKPIEPIVAGPTVVESQPAGSPAMSAPSRRQSGFEAALGKINFTTRQWIMMGILLLLVVCILVTFILVVLFTLR